jgi:hypothetical protein
MLTISEIGMSELKSMKYIKNEVKNKDTSEFLRKDIYQCFIRNSSMEAIAREAIIIHIVNWMAKNVSSI